MLYDAIVVGASFAGLAVARRLDGKVLLIDKGEVGTGQTSACGTPLSMAKRLGLRGAVQQIHRALIVHTAAGRITYSLRDPYCTFDYETFCRELMRGIDARYVRAVVHGLQGDEVITDQGRFRSRVLVDASGWRAVLASSVSPGFVDRRAMSFGIEMETECRGHGLHFWLDPAVVPAGMGWLFPCDSRARVGLASHAGDTNLLPRLKAFVAARGLDLGPRLHGGFYPWRLRAATVGALFVVGDAAGQCLALTGEGIRPALCFGDYCGQIVQRIITGELTHAAAQRAYRAFVDRRSRQFTGMLLAQRLTDAVSNRQLTLLCQLAAWPPLLRLFFLLYDAAAEPDMLGRHDRSLVMGATRGEGEELRGKRAKGEKGKRAGEKRGR